ncbi:MAG: hypothetical protein KAI66_08515 [Lentisphaeria bacterium]|nr:hypothetical protein [Lentisphaeria bacterium]
MGGAIVGLIWAAVVVLVLVSKISKSMKDYQENRPAGDSEDGWQERGEVPQVGRRPPATVDELLGQLRQGIEQATRPTPPPVPPSPAPVRRKAVVRVKEPLPVASLSGDLGTLGEMNETGQRQASKLVTESLSGAFPKAQAMTKQLARGTRSPVSLSVKGRSALRRGILLSEVLGPPRAFDV